MKRGRCAACGATVNLTQTGELRTHGPIGWRCPGSGYYPAPDLALDPINGRCVVEED